MLSLGAVPGWRRGSVLLCVQEPPLHGLVRQLSIDQLDNEGRRVSVCERGGWEGRTPNLVQRSHSITVRVADKPSGCGAHGCDANRGLWAAGECVLQGQRPQHGVPGQCVKQRTAAVEQQCTGVW